jgi:hypothetical protein
LAVGDGGAVGAEVKLGLQIEREKFGALGFDDGDVLVTDGVLIAVQFGGGLERGSARVGMERREFPRTDDDDSLA